MGVGAFLVVCYLFRLAKIADEKALIRRGDGGRAACWHNLGLFYRFLRIAHIAQTLNNHELIIGISMIWQWS